MKYVLGIDQGTTGSTAILFDRQGNPRGRGYREITQHYPKPGWVEHDPEEIVAATGRAVSRALRDAGAKGRDLAAVGVTNQRETTVIWERATGRPIHNAIVWQCRRTAPTCDALRAAGFEKTVRARTGLPLDAYFSGTKVAWLLDHVPGARQRAEKGDLAFGTIDTWLLSRLAQGAPPPHLTDFTNASRTLLFNIRERRWDAAILDRLRIPAALLPEARPSSGEFGRTRRVAGLPAGLPIAALVGDQQAALFGQACFDPGSVKNTYGTGCFMLQVAGPEFVASRHGLLTTLAVGRGGRTVYALEGSVFIAGAAVQWLRDGLGIIRRAAETEELARSVPDNAGVYLVPAFTGLGAPYWDQAARGALVGLTRGAGRAHLCRAALESIAYQSTDVLRAMEADSGRRITRLKVDGGAVANGFLMQFQADLLGAVVARSRVAETTALGAACLAGLAVGFWKSESEIEGWWRADREFKPAMRSRDRDALYAAWQRAVARTRG
ncbi:MAG: glycerol kinase GlpK [Planctomycetes bacterium]|nr:glycerol kinase GlpK [Planctomycetota bacterium]